MSRKIIAAWSFAAALLVAATATAQDDGPMQDPGGGVVDDTGVDDTGFNESTPPEELQSTTGNETGQPPMETPFRASATLMPACAAWMDMGGAGNGSGNASNGAGDDANGTMDDDANGTMDDDTSGNANDVTGAMPCLSPSQFMVPDGVTSVALNLTNQANMSLVVAWGPMNGGAGMMDASNASGSAPTLEGMVTVPAGGFAEAMIMMSTGGAKLMLGMAGPEIGNLTYAPPIEDGDIDAGEDVDRDEGEATEDDRTPMPAIVLVVGAIGLAALVVAHRRRS